MAKFVRVKTKRGFKKIPLCQVCGHLFSPTTRRPIHKLKTCSYRCRDVMRLWHPEFVAHLRAIAPNMRGKKRAPQYGAKNPAWKGGVTFKRNKGNYIGPKYIRCPVEFLPMARKDGYVMEHRLVMAKAMGRMLTRIEVVHHRDHNTRNNSIENLEWFPDNRTHKLAEAAERRKSKKDLGLR